jgi:hypothetical protein
MFKSEMILNWFYKYSELYFLMFFYLNDDIFYLNLHIKILLDEVMVTLIYLSNL